MPAFGFGLPGIGGDQVVGLVAIEFHRMGRKGNRGLPDERKLRHKFFRCLCAVRLVGGKEVIAERLGRSVEDARKMRRPLSALEVFQQLEQHVAETRDRPDRQAIGLTRQRGQGMERAEDVGARIDQVEMALVVDWGRGHGRFLCAAEGFSFIPARNHPLPRYVDLSIRHIPARAKCGSFVACNVTSPSMKPWP
jgi:hypothetical protein